MKAQQLVALAFVILLGVSVFTSFEVRDEVRMLREEIKFLRQIHD
mgnify:CR=1 FL=1